MSEDHLWELILNYGLMLCIRVYGGIIKLSNPHADVPQDDPEVYDSLQHVVAACWTYRITVEALLNDMAAVASISHRDLPLAFIRKHAMSFAQGVASQTSRAPDSDAVGTEVFYLARSVDSLEPDEAANFIRDRVMEGNLRPDLAFCVAHQTGFLDLTESLRHLAMWWFRTRPDRYAVLRRVYPLGNEV